MKTDVVSEVIGKIQAEWDLSEKDLQKLKASSFNTKLEFIEFFDLVNSLFNSKTQAKAWILSHEFSAARTFKNVIENNPEELSVLKLYLSHLANP